MLCSQRITWECASFLSWRQLAWQYAQKAQLHSAHHSAKQLEKSRKAIWHSGQCSVSRSSAIRFLCVIARSSSAATWPPSPRADSGTTALTSDHARSAALLPPPAPPLPPADGSCSSPSTDSACALAIA